MKALKKRRDGEQGWEGVEKQPDLFFLSVASIMAAAPPSSREIA